MAIHLLNHDAKVTLTNDVGMDCIATAEEVLQQVRNRQMESLASVDEWGDFIEELKSKESLEKARMEARERARTQANDE